MALLFSITTPPTTRLSLRSSSTSSTFAHPYCFATKVTYQLLSSSTLIFKERSVLIAKTASDIDSGDSDNPESDEESMSVDNLPLESKLQLKLEQKMKMKLAKNIRLRRKKLVRKRRLRKKGRWLPSKLKNKNV